ncbi:hypothetical protein OSB04_005133 [Centaurea solstitialis]|uniref:Beta-galactosidase n=1 Tax=Centaurea solstitialis TaxID=347529 RepID=A0AA38U030_9ASTR|nr:hypothetical protein OSB04_005133 [Centaurea solstitialis]
MAAAIATSIAFFIIYLQLNLIQAAVTYDHRSLIINGHRRILISGSIHYPRSTPEMWEDLVIKAKNGGLDVIDTYVFWNVHEPSPGNYDFSGRYDLVRFIKTVASAGLYVNLRIGPYVCAEWNFGGFPVWLKYVPGISFRTDNEPFKAAMQGFTQKIVEMMKAENLYESQGGPIILSQIENEYGAQRNAFGPAAETYIHWAAKMAVGLNTGVRGRCAKKTMHPILWFTEFGAPVEQRPVHDLAFAVARFVQKGGSYFNYYMYHGGTNFGRTSGGPFITTSYDYDAPIDEYGLIREPKYGHLTELHRAIKLCEPAFFSSDPIYISLGQRQNAYVYEGNGNCAAFLSNFETTSAIRVVFRNRHYKLPPWSISILPDCKNVVFNTAKVVTQTSRMRMMPTGSSIQSWEAYHEDISTLADEPSLSSFGLLDQINITRDTSDYLWYSTSIDVDPSESFLREGRKPTLVVLSKGHGLHVFVNGQHSGSAYGSREDTRFTLHTPVDLRGGTNQISLLSMAAGLPNVGMHFEARDTGILGPVSLDGLDHGTTDLSTARWTYKVGLNGEMKNLISPNGISSVEWSGVSLVNRAQQPLKWYKAYFDAPEGNDPLALDMKSMIRGQVWINGQSIGRYWTAQAKGNCGSCKYPGAFKPGKCQAGCGAPTQRWYHVPRSWLKPTQNLLVLFEEVGGNISRISLVKRTPRHVCASTFEHHPVTDNWQTESTGETTMLHDTKVRLQCGLGQSISAINFASFGTPFGGCGDFRQGACHAPNSREIVEKTCVGQESCEVTASNNYFATDPCPKVLKRLLVEAVCSVKPT